MPSLIRGVNPGIFRRKLHGMPPRSQLGKNGPKAHPKQLPLLDLQVAKWTQQGYTTSSARHPAGTYIHREHIMAKRRSIPNGQSQRHFTRNAKTHRKNLMGAPLRGGIRL